MPNAATHLEQHIPAPRAAVYRALVDPRAVATWMVPDGMSGHVHELDARVGGRFRVTLTYDAPTDAGKSTARSDSYHGRFVELVPDERVVEAIEFETADPAMRGEMTVTMTLADAEGGTLLVATHADLPPGLSPDDNEVGWRMSLGKLSKLVAGGTVPDAALERHLGALRVMLKSQYHAALAMLRECVERCPDPLWYDDRPKTPYWQHAYHALYFTDLYLQPTSESLHSWEGHQSGVQHPDGIPGRDDPASELPLIPKPYSREEVLAYWAVCDTLVDTAVDALDLLSGESGFGWYPIPKLEHQLVNLRHVQHHAAQLADRLRASEDVGIRWVGSRRPDRR